MSRPVGMRTLLEKAASLGFDESQCRAILPEWWNDELAETPAGYVESAMILAKGLRVRFSSLLREDEEVRR